MVCQFLSVVSAGVQVGSHQKLVNSVLDVMPSDMSNETKPEEGHIESYRYRPIYGNILPGKAEPEPT
jgi:hypothetical protein